MPLRQTILEIIRVFGTVQRSTTPSTQTFAVFDLFARSLDSIGYVFELDRIFRRYFDVLEQFARFEVGAGSISF